MNLKTKLSSIAYLFIGLGIVSCAKNDAPKTEALKAKDTKPLNVIVMIGDGMGVPQISTAFYFQQDRPNFERFKHIGFIKTSSTSHKITDSAAGATAFATGEKTYKRAIGVNTDSVAIPTILEQLESKGYKTGLVSLTSITHATPASYYAHVTDRDMHEEIADYLVPSGIDFFAGGGLKYFTQPEQSASRYKQLLDKGYVMDSSQLGSSLNPEKQYGYLLAENGLPSKTEGRQNFLSEAAGLALNHLSASDSGFFLMIEGSFIDWGGHANDAEMVISEVLDFDKTLGTVLDFVEKDGNTLLIVTADHETGGLAIGKSYRKDPATGEQTEIPDSVSLYFTTDQHTTELIPVFAFGPGAEDFTGIYENNEIFHKTWEILKR